MTNTTRAVNSTEANQIMTHSLTNLKEGSLTWTTIATNSPITQDQGDIIQVRAKAMDTSTGPEKETPIDLVDLGVELLAETEKLPGTPGRRVTCLTTAEIMTLAMGDIIENTARRPCIMGGHL